MAKRYQLLTKLYAGNEVDLTIAEAALLQERVAKLYEAPLVVRRIGDLLEGREPEVASKASVAENLDPTNVAAKDETKPPITVRDMD